MRKSTRLTALGAAACAVLGSLTLVFASPASANHVFQPACDIFRQTIITTNTAANNALAEQGVATTNLGNATTNLGVAGAQLVTPTVNLIVATENQVGVATAQSAFDNALAVFNAAVNAYVAALTQKVTIDATVDINTQILPFLQGVRSGIDGQPSLACPNPI